MSHDFIYNASVTEAVEEQRKLVARASKRYEHLREKDTGYARDLFDLMEFHNDVLEFMECAIAARQKSEQSRKNLKF